MWRIGHLRHSWTGLVHFMAKPVTIGERSKQRKKLIVGLHILSYTLGSSEQRWNGCPAQAYTLEILLLSCQIRTSFGYIGVARKLNFIPFAYQAYRDNTDSSHFIAYFIPGGVRAFGPVSSGVLSQTVSCAHDDQGKINYHFKFSGPSFSIDTACSSSLAAIQLACTSLWAGDCDTAVAGGMNILTVRDPEKHSLCTWNTDTVSKNPDIFSGLSRGQFLSKKGPCATFDNDADGYCRADGVGSVVLKRLEDAQADKDPILAVILGAATNHSAEAVSITHPHAGAQEFLYKKVLNAAAVDPHEVSYVEMHGTGTQGTSFPSSFCPLANAPWVIEPKTCPLTSRIARKRKC